MDLVGEVRGGFWGWGEYVVVYVVGGDYLGVEFGVEVVEVGEGVGEVCLRGK